MWGEARGEHAGLAGAGAGQHQQRAVERFRRLALFRVQAVEVVRRGRRRGGRASDSAGKRVARNGASRRLVHGPVRGRDSAYYTTGAAGPCLTVRPSGDLRTILRAVAAHAEAVALGP